MFVCGGTSIVLLSVANLYGAIVVGMGGGNRTQRYRFIRLRPSRLLLNVYIPFRVVRRAVASQAAAGDSTALDTDTHLPYHCHPSED